MKDISVIIPAYNEESHIVANVLKVGRALWHLGNVQVIIVDDGSTDNTLRYVCRYFEGVRGFTIIHNKTNLGKGAAIRAGLGQVKGEYIVFIDADLDIAPQQVRMLLDVMELEDSDVVIGSKLHKCSVVHYPVSRKILSLGYYWVIKILFGLCCHDTQTGLKLFRASALNKLTFDTDGFAFDLEILARLSKLGCKISEAPIILESQREYGRIGPRIIWRTWRDTYKIWKKLKG